MACGLEAGEVRLSDSGIQALVRWAPQCPDDHAQGGAGSDQDEVHGRIGIVSVDGVRGDGTSPRADESAHEPAEAVRALGIHALDLFPGETPFTCEITARFRI